MTEQDELLLNQYLDDELSREHTLTLKQRLLAEPELREQFDALRNTDRALKAAFSQRDRRVPEHIRKMLIDAPASSLPNRTLSLNWLMLGAAASISAVVGLALTVQGVFGTQDSQQFDYVLSSLPSSSEQWYAVGEQGQVQPVLSFRSRTMHWCREYLIGSESAKLQRGVACHENGQWRIKVQAPAKAMNASDNYITASAADSDQVADYVTEHALDIPISAREEATLIASQWQ